MCSPDSSAIDASVPMIVSRTSGAIPIGARRRSASWTPMRSSSVRRGKTRQPMWRGGFTGPDLAGTRASKEAGRDDDRGGWHGEDPWNKSPPTPSNPSRRGRHRTDEQGGSMRATKGILIASAAATLVLGGAVLARADQKTGGDM